MQPYMSLGGGGFEVSPYPTPPPPEIYVKATLSPSKILQSKIFGKIAFLKKNIPKHLLRSKKHKNFG
jgi:hypothetical protein